MASFVKSPLNDNSYTIRLANRNDAIFMWRLVEESAILDHNSFYCYFVLSNFFSSTCAVAEVQNRIIGFVTGFIEPERPDTYFVWQVRVVKSARQKGIGSSLIKFIIGKHEGIRYVEATISPSNAASQHLFFSIAKYYGVEVVEDDNFLPSSSFPIEAGVHEQENLFRVGPIKRV